jgi:hypothetical protein
LSDYQLYQYAQKYLVSNASKPSFESYVLTFG